MEKEVEPDSPGATPEVQVEPQEVLRSAVTPEASRQKTGLIVGIITLALFLLGAVGFLGYQNYQLKQSTPPGQLTPTPPTSPTPSSLIILSEFVKMASRFAKPATGEMTGGIVPEPPRAFLKEAERFAEKWIKYPAKITYAFVDYAAGPTSSNSLVVYAASEPFRWRVDFNTSREDTDYKTIYLYDGKDYSSCNVAGNTLPDCYRASPEFLEKELQTPIPLTELLNDILDSRTLEKLMPEVAKSGQAQEQKDMREITGYPAECKLVSDEYRTFDFCVAEGTNLLIYLDVKSTSATGKVLRQFTLTAQDVELSPDLQEAFTLP